MPQVCQESQSSYENSMEECSEATTTIATTLNLDDGAIYFIIRSCITIQSSTTRELVNLEFVWNELAFWWDNVLTQHES